MPVTGKSTESRLDEFERFAQELADASRALLQDWRNGSGYEMKDDSSPVTALDARIEAELRRLIRCRYPDHGIIGEEGDTESPEADFVWVLDPIDGTKPFTAGMPVFTTLIALCEESTPVIGLIDAPATASRWLGVRGKTTTENGQPVRTSKRTRLDKATLAWSDPRVVLEDHLRGQEELAQRVAWRIAGADALGYASVASGHLDVAIDSGRMLVTDICAFPPIIQGAGGACTDGFGEPITLFSQLSCAASATPELHEQVIESLNLGKE